MTYQFKIDIFEGPLDLLLHLLKEQKMDIYDIPIADITRQYLQYLEMMQDLNLEVAGDYLIMAAELARIKSRVLLPVQPADEEGEEQGEDPRADLMRRLLEYQRYKEAAFELRKREYDRQQLFSRHGEVVVEDAAEEPLVDVTLFDLLNAYQKVLQKKSFKKDYEIKITTLSVADRIKYVLEILNASESATFESLFTAADSRQEIIVLFLAILELMRLRLVRVHQAGHFDAIRIYKNADKEAQEDALRNFEEPEKTPDL